MKFSDLQLPRALSQAIEKMGFTTPTPIQEQAIPVALIGKDVLGCAQTGTGKTAAFSIPMLCRLLADGYGSALILVPTRELAAQVTEVIADLTRFLPEMKPVLLIGGVSMDPQIRNLRRRPRILVATPGRLVDHLRRRTADLRGVKTLILDEADRMLDIGFAPQLREILQALPSERQTMLFSATVSPEIEKLSHSYLNAPVKVTIGAPSTAKAEIQQTLQEVDGKGKNPALLEALNAREGSVLVFARTQNRTDRVARYLETYGVAVARIHGGRTQGQRTRALEGFRSGAVRVLVATDIAARGIDIDHVAHVINYDLPMVAEDYIHRIGRTGRAGRSGQALSLMSHEERPLWRAIEKLLKGAPPSTANPPRSGAGNSRPGNSRPGNTRGRRPFRGPRNTEKPAARN
jgi:superfamily II DNA/RNA helicase